MDVRFGPFTCIAGANGVGKSNLFDAIEFLSLLADHTLVDAAVSVRASTNRSSDVRALFQRFGDNHADTMSFEVDMVVPWKGQDEPGQAAEASYTLLRYSLTLAYQKEAGPGGLEIRREGLVSLKRAEAARHLLFHHHKAWRESAIARAAPYICTESEAGDVSSRGIRTRHMGGPSN